MFDERPVCNITGSNLEGVHPKIVEEVRAFFIEGRGQEFDTDAFGFLVQSSKCIKGQFELSEKLLQIRLILRVTEFRRLCGRQALGTKSLKLHRIRSRPFGSPHEGQGSLYVSSMIEAGLGNHID